MGTVGGIRDREEARLLLESRRDYLQLALVSHTVSRVSVTWADTSVSQPIAKEYHPIHSSIPDIPLDDGPKPLPYPLDYLTSQKAMRKACQLLLEKRGDWIGLPGLREVAEGVDNEHWGAVSSWMLEGDILMLKRH